MEEQQAVTPSSDTSTAELSTDRAPPPPMKQNRKQRRQMQAFNRSMQLKANSSNAGRMNDFKVLTAWKDKEEARQRLSSEQIASVFRVALARLFKGTEIIRKREKVTFDQQLTAIVRNVKSGFKYKADTAPALDGPEAVV